MYIIHCINCVNDHETASVNGPQNGQSAQSEPRLRYPHEERLGP